MWSSRKNKEKVDDAEVSLPQTIPLVDQGVTASQPIASTKGMNPMASFLPSSLYTSVSTPTPISKPIYAYASFFSNAIYTPIH